MEMFMDRLRIYSTCTALTLFFILLTNCAQLTETPKSALESVDIPQTTVKDQNRIGFCWAYATIGLIESNYKAKTGRTVDLSEEALGYVRMKEEMLQIAREYKAGRLSLDNAIAETQGNELEGWYVRLSDGSPTRDSMEMIDSVGLVPESAWNIKFTSAASVSRLKSAIKGPFKSLLESGSAITSESLDQVLTSPNAFPSKPPTIVTIDGQSMTAQAFASSVLQFKSSDYVALQASSASHGLTLIGVLKRAMQAGYSVPISFGVSFNNLRGSTFSAPNFTINQLSTSPDIVRQNLNLTGGHAVLGTDFVNEGGVEGAIDPAELEIEVSKSAEELSYIKFKNSWGATPTVNEQGEPVHSNDNGYYKMDLGYIKLLSKAGRFGIVVPRAFAH